jgi:hypothetical protein
MARRESDWSSIEDQIASLLDEIPRGDSRLPPTREIPDGPTLLSDAPSLTYRLIRAVLIVSGAAAVISIVSPYLAWFAASLTS